MGDWCINGLLGVENGPYASWKRSVNILEYIKIKIKLTQGSNDETLFRCLGPLERVAWVAECRWGEKRVVGKKKKGSWYINRMLGVENRPYAVLEREVNIIEHIK